MITASAAGRGPSPTTVPARAGRRGPCRQRVATGSRFGAVAGSYAELVRAWVEPALPQRSSEPAHSNLHQRELHHRRAPLLSESGEALRFHHHALRSEALPL
jgi:hypothetical protein